ncbi:uncharacterized protein N7511_006880 [Penicillium nucicola]|uniref:uncharacterized protein n=1 Tax=Penicillium nucicola TaxID=1850975 RepID=UPI0025451275|nr:uncharacterized protein N7511_006880 [Penicillium nucicola]KAJ5758186.1 hypothetical protein N7511_006880 [Penicillium nucicola]
MNFRVDAIIIGAGFSGCYALYRLRQLGLQAKIIEAGSDFGGVWHWNRYPGARVDGDCTVYQFSDPEIWQGWEWRERFSSSDDLRRYFQHAAKLMDLRKDTIFDTSITRCEYDSGTGSWVIHTAQGWHTVCTYLIPAVGATVKPFIPSIPGLDLFAGTVVHPSRYPKTLDVYGKSVGIVGNGSSAVQLVQALKKQDAKLTVFIRKPCIGIPMRQRDISYGEAMMQKSFSEAIFEKTRRSEASCAYNNARGSAHDFTAEERRAILDEVWRRGDWNILLASFSDYAVDETVNSLLYDYWAQQVRSRMTDQRKMDLVAPLKQNQWWATKRPCLEQNYYEVIDDPDVNVHDLHSAPIAEVEDRGIVTGFGPDDREHHRLDVIIFATGYDAFTGSLLDIGLRDRHGQTLRDKWSGGIITYLGMMIPDMPNLFVINGPQSPASVTCGPPFLEQQVDWVCQIIAKMKDERFEKVEATQEAADEWGNEMHAVADATLNMRTDSWWNGANIPGKFREPLVYFGGYNDG